LFQLSVDDNPLNKKWVLVVSINWNKEQYFIGNFDGKEFKLIENHPKEALYVDKGLDYYASRTFRDYDNTLKTVSTMGWVATWDYAPHVPSTYGKGFWSLPRDLALKTFPEGLRMIQTPVKQLEQLRYDEISFQHTWKWAYIGYLNSHLRRIVMKWMFALM
jgi:fructan beta-fructosidase